MKIIPAIDIKQGKCVRLFQGRSDRETVYSDDPVAMAKRWAGEGAEILHIVDLDGAFEGGLTNFNLISEIIKSVDIRTEIGGGIRDMDSVSRYLETGVDKVILGTVAQSNPEFVREACQKFPERIIVGIDASNGKVAVKGWESVTEENAIDMAKRMQGLGVYAIIYTDISRDGSLAGPNIEAVKNLARAIDIPLIASGGVSNLSDIEALLALEKFGVCGVIVGKAIYTDNLSLPEAIRLTRIHKLYI